MENIIRYVAPCLTAILIFLVGEDFIEAPERYARGWKIIGLLFPALWLTSIGPKGLVTNGGFIMQLLKIKPTKKKVVLFSLIWFLFFLICSYILSIKIFHNQIIVCFIYSFAHCGLMGSLGAFTFLAVMGRDKKRIANKKNVKK